MKRERAVAARRVTGWLSPRSNIAHSSSFVNSSISRCRASSSSSRYGSSRSGSRQVRSAISPRSPQGCSSVSAAVPASGLVQRMTSPSRTISDLHGLPSVPSSRALRRVPASSAPDRPGESPAVTAGWVRKLSIVGRAAGSRRERASPEAVFGGARGRLIRRSTGRGGNPVRFPGRHGPLLPLSSSRTCSCSSSAAPHLSRVRPCRERPAGEDRLVGRSALLVGLFAATAPLPGSGPADAQAAEVDPEATRLWNDFSHYVLIARPDLAAQAGEALAGLDGAAVLAAVEADDRSIRRVFDRAEGMEASAGVAARLEAMLAQSARDQARNPERIAADVDRLGVSQRAFDNGVDRLSAAGPYAAPSCSGACRTPAARTCTPT